MALKAGDMVVHHSPNMKRPYIQFPEGQKKETEVCRYAEQGRLGGLRWGQVGETLVEIFHFDAVFDITRKEG